MLSSLSKLGVVVSIFITKIGLVSFLIRWIVFEISIVSSVGEIVFNLTNKFSSLALATSLSSADLFSSNLSRFKFLSLISMPGDNRYLLFRIGLTREFGILLGLSIGVSFGEVFKVRSTSELSGDVKLLVLLLIIRLLTLLSKEEDVKRSRVEFMLSFIELVDVASVVIGFDVVDVVVVVVVIVVVVGGVVENDVELATVFGLLYAIGAKTFARNCPDTFPKGSYVQTVKKRLPFLRRD